MSVRAYVLGFALAGCGRLGFGALSDAASSDAVDDAQPPLPCGVSASAPDPITITGNTYRYTAFDNTHTPVSMVGASATDGTAILGANVSDANGAYSFSIPTGGSARAVTLGYFVGGFFNTYVTTGYALDRNITGTSSNLWEVGDAPVWNAVGMTAIYDTMSLTRSDDAGTLNVAIRTCAGAAIAGVTVTLDPAPEAIGYTTPTGIALGGTQTPYSHAVAFNAIAGETRITATAPGLTFPTITIVVAGGVSNTLTILQPYD